MSHLSSFPHHLIVTRSLSFHHAILSKENFHQKVILENIAEEKEGLTLPQFTHQSSLSKHEVIHRTSSWSGRQRISSYKRCRDVATAMAQWSYRKLCGVYVLFGSVQSYGLSCGSYPW